MKPTSATTEEIKQHLAQSFSLLKTLRDEIRVELHLAGMEAKQRFAELEHRFADADRIVREASASSKATIEEAVRAFQFFRDSLNADARMHSNGTIIKTPRASSGGG